MAITARSGGSPKRLLVLVGIGAVLILVNMVLPKLLFGAGPEDEAIVVPRGRGPAALTAPGDGDEHDQTFETFSDENPFEPVVAVPIADTGDEGDEDEGDDGPPGTPTVGDRDGDGLADEVDDSDGDGLPDSIDPATGPGPTTPTAPTQPTTPPTTESHQGGPATTSPPLPRTTGGGGSQGTIVELLELYVADRGGLVASVRVDAAVSTVGEGDRFASNFEVVSLSVADQCGEFLYGDDRFDLCVNQSLLK